MQLNYDDYLLNLLRCSQFYSSSWEYRYNTDTIQLINAVFQVLYDLLLLLLPLPIIFKTNFRGRDRGNVTRNLPIQAYAYMF